MPKVIDLSIGQRQNSSCRPRCTCFPFNATVDSCVVINQAANVLLIFIIDRFESFEEILFQLLIVWADCFHRFSSVFDRFERFLRRTFTHYWLLEWILWRSLATLQDSWSFTAVLRGHFFGLGGNWEDFSSFSGTLWNLFIVWKDSLMLSQESLRLLIIFKIRRLILPRFIRTAWHSLGFSVFSYKDFYEILLKKS